MNTEKIKGIIFDLDGTLYNARFLPLAITVFNVRRLVILCCMCLCLNKVRSKNFKNRKRFYRSLFSRMSTVTFLSEEKIEDWYFNSYYRNFAVLLQKFYKRRKNILGLLHLLKNKDYKLAVLSENDMVNERLNALDIDHKLFDRVACTIDFGVLKPSNIPFNSIADEWNTDPANILVVGDRKDRDLPAAQKAGMEFFKLATNRELEELTALFNKYGTR